MRPVSPRATPSSMMSALSVNDFMSRVRLWHTVTVASPGTAFCIISEATGAKFTYIPFKSGGDAAIQLAGAHIDANVTNPNENIGQWKANMVRPLCVFSPNRMAAGPKVTKDMAWSEIPTCKESGVPIETYQMPRTIWSRILSM